MRAPFPGFPWRLAGGAAVVAAYAAASHWMMLYHPSAPWALAALLGPLWLAVVGLAGQWAGRWGQGAVAVAGLALVAAVSLGGAVGANRLYVLQHVGINTALCCWFGASLRGRPLSLIGQLAQRLHRQLTPDMVAYTRKVTLVWTIYFFTVAAVSLAVYALLPFTAWSFYSNVLAPVSLAGLFIGEHVVRYWIHPEFERVRMADAVRAFQTPASAAPEARP